MKFNFTLLVCIPCAIGLVLQPMDVQARTQRAYIKRDGTYVQSHQKNNPDRRRYNNLSSQTNGGKQRDEFSSPPKYNKGSQGRHSK